MITKTILVVLYYKHSIMGPKTLFELLRPLYWAVRLLTSFPIAHQTGVSIFRDATSCHQVRPSPVLGFIRLCDHPGFNLGLTVLV